ncbi:MAG: glycoside hydrolase family 27 protein [Bacteroidales bacterium]|nr:glycoside hydrolase family 27 protein [Bacteroidales bacterium]
MTARDIAVDKNITPWFKGMMTVDMSKPGAQEYYNSLIQLYANWGIDFIKIDGISFNPFSPDEIEGYKKAIQKTGRDIVLSLSPGPAPVKHAPFFNEHAHMWRMSSDVWDSWFYIDRTFTLCEKWNKHRSEGCWPDADMLCLGNIGIRSEIAEINGNGKYFGTGRYTRLSKDEQFTMMSLWAMFKSPLFFGGNLPDNDEFTKKLITNSDLIYINQYSTNNQQLLKTKHLRVWVADCAGKKNKYVAIFNVSNEEQTFYIPKRKFSTAGFSRITNIWTNKPVELLNGEAGGVIPSHGVLLIKLSND